MNKVMKRFMGAALAVSALGTIDGAKYVGLNIEAKADSDDDYGIKNIQLNKGTSSSEIPLYDDGNYKNKIDFDKDTKEYYAKTNLASVSFELEAEKGYEIKAFKSDKDTATAYESGDKMSLSSGQNTIYVRTYEKGDFDANEVDDKVVKEYEINIERQDNTKEDKDQDKIYLEDISLSVGNIDFDKKITSYSVALETGDREITIKAKPENDGDDVRVDGKSVDDKYKRKVNLRLGQNQIKVQVKDEEDKQRIYTLNILRGDDTSNTNSSDKETTSDEKEEENKTENNNTESNINNNAANTAQSDTTYKNQWIHIDGAWKYSDATGNIIKDTWFYDQNTGKQYYLQSDGSMATGWFKLNNDWYYLGIDGGKQTGWTALSGNWYYLDYNGVMKTGWFRDADGKWYYLDNYGVMARNTTIDGYKLGSDGVMV